MQWPSFSPASFATLASSTTSSSSNLGSSSSRSSSSSRRHKGLASQQMQKRQKKSTATTASLFKKATEPQKWSDCWAWWMCKARIVDHIKAIQAHSVLFNLPPCPVSISAARRSSEAIHKLRAVWEAAEGACAVDHPDAFVSMVQGFWRAAHQPTRAVKTPPAAAAPAAAPVPVRFKRPGSRSSPPTPPLAAPSTPPLALFPLFSSFSSPSSSRSSSSFAASTSSSSSSAASTSSSSSSAASSSSSLSMCAASVHHPSIWDDMPPLEACS